VGGFKTKYDVDRPLVLVVWPIQERNQFHLGCNNHEGDNLEKKSKKYMSKNIWCNIFIVG
jgi:hypothetical protein